MYQDLGEGVLRLFAEAQGATTGRMHLLLQYKSFSVYRHVGRSEKVRRRRLLESRRRWRARVDREIRDMRRVCRAWLAWEP